MSDWADDIASDMSAFHRIADISVMRSDVLVRLAYRLPAYHGALAARIAERRAQQQAAGPGRRGRGVTQPRYERNSGMANNGRTADSAPPATASSLAAVNAALGERWFNVVQVPKAAGGGNSQ